MSGAPGVIILGLDTTTSVTTAGIIRSGRPLGERVESLRRGDHARSLPAMVNEVLVEAGVAVAELDAVAVAVGPGSFTGIRVGIGFAKGIAFARSIPLIGVGTLDALAEVAGDRDLPLAACLDARKGEVYLAFYEPAPPGTPRDHSGEIEALSPAAAAARIAQRFSGGAAIVIGDATSVYSQDFSGLAAAGIRSVPFSAVHPRGGVVAALGERQLAIGAGTSPEGVSAIYVRPSAAEISRGVTR